MTRRIEIDELRRKFKSTAQDALEESEFATREKAKEIIDRRLAKVDVDAEETEETDEGNDEEDDVFTLEELTEQLPEDLAEAVEAQLTESEAMKAKAAGLPVDAPERSAFGTVLAALNSEEGIQIEKSTDRSDDLGDAALAKLKKDIPDVEGES